MNEEILNQLKDVHWPTPPSFWPPAPGIYGLLCLIIIILCGLYFLWRLPGLRRKRNLFREFAHIEANYLEDLDMARLQASLSALLRRIIFHKYPELRKDLDLDAMKESLLVIFPKRQKISNLLELLTKDRFRKAPDVRGEDLLKLFREELKRCRI